MLQYKYFVAAIDDTLPLPDKRVRLTFAGDSFELVPPTSDTYAAVVLDVSNKGDRPAAGFARCDQDLKAVNRFLSALCWTMGHGATVIASGGGSNSLPIVRSSYSTVTVGARGYWLFEAQNDRQRRALALFREGLAIEHSFQASSFTAFFRAMEAAFDCYREAELRPKIEGLSLALSQEAVAMMGGQTLTRFLVRTNRHAFAHGAEDSTHSPDDAERVRPIRARIQLMKIVAAAAMTQTLGIPTMCGMIEAQRNDPLAATGWVSLSPVGEGV